MVVNKVPESAGFSIKVRKGTDALGNATYNKSLSPMSRKIQIQQLYLQLQMPSKKFSKARQETAT